MKTRLAYFSSVLILCGGCASLQQVELGKKDQWIAGAQADLLNKDATVITVDGRTQEGKIILLDSDSLSLQDESSIAPLSFSIGRVSAIRPSRNTGAPIGGFWGGLVIGAAVGGAIGAVQETSEPNPWVFGLDVALEKSVNTTSYGVIGAIIGSVSMGMILGLATAVTDYQIIHSPLRNVSGRTTPVIPDSARTGNVKQAR